MACMGIGLQLTGLELAEPQTLFPDRCVKLSLCLVHLAFINAKEPMQSYVLSSSLVPSFASSLSLDNSPGHRLDHRNFIGMYMYMPWYMHVKYRVSLTFFLNDSHFTFILLLPLLPLWLMGRASRFHRDMY